MNPAAVRQISTGSVLGLFLCNVAGKKLFVADAVETGLVSGLGISMFSKPLAVMIGVLILAVQVCFVCSRLLLCFA